MPVAFRGGMDGFATWTPAHGTLADRSPVAVLRGWLGDDPLGLPGGETTHFGIARAPSTLRCSSGEFALQTGMWFSVPGEAEIAGGAGVVICALGHRGLFTLGGPVETTGRLRYIDGCTDTLLVGPPRVGDPCLNALYFPPGTDQTAHTHPSLRAGVVLSGRGICRLGDEDAPLDPGLAFLIDTDTLHAFATPPDEGMVVVAFHPDSDTGPSDEEHPMLTRTIVDGVPAHLLESR